MKLVNICSRILMLILAIFLFFVAIAHFFFSSWYHGFFPGFEYTDSDIFDKQAAITIGFWTLVFSILVLYTFVSWYKVPKLIFFISFVCFGFVIMQFFNLMNGRFPWQMALTFCIAGILNLAASKSIENKKAKLANTE